MNSPKVIASCPDALKFLQGIVTANLASKASDDTPRPGYYAGFLNATGRVVHDVLIYRDTHGLGGAAVDQGGDAFLVEVDAAQADRLAKYIKRYKLRAKVNLRKIPTDEISVWQAWDDAESPEAASLPSFSTNDTSRLILKDPRAPGMGYRILQSNGQAPQVDLDTTNEDAYTIRRYLTGIGEGQDELLRETALPQESNMDIMNGIDFRKGCYVGQELTVRTKHRGVVRKRILPCIIYPKTSSMPTSLTYDPTAEAPGAETIPTEKSIGRFEKRGRSAGKWLRGVGNVGLALCRLETMTDVVLPGETAAAGYSPEDEFILEWGGEGVEEAVKIKAFVPDWLRAGLDAQR
ncbi:Aminomethyltransferase folate-binding domain-containing protein [Sarocladium strictum]